MRIKMAQKTGGLEFVASTGHTAGNPWWTVAMPVLSVVFLAAVFAGLVPMLNGGVKAVAMVLLCGAIFAAVHHAEMIAARVGEPFGSIILAVAVTVIEVGLIVALMLASPDGGPAIARDTVYSAVMIVLTGLIGLCLVLGSAHFPDPIQDRKGCGNGNQQYKQKALEQGHTLLRGSSHQHGRKLPP